MLRCFYHTPWWVNRWVSKAPGRWDPVWPWWSCPFRWETCQVPLPHVPRPRSWYRRQVAGSTGIAGACCGCCWFHSWAFATDFCSCSSANLSRTSFIWLSPPSPSACLWGWLPRSSSFRSTACTLPWSRYTFTTLSTAPCFQGISCSIPVSKGSMGTFRPVFWLLTALLLILRSMLWTCSVPVPE